MSFDITFEHMKIIAIVVASKRKEVAQRGGAR